VETLQQPQKAKELEISIDFRTLLQRALYYKWFFLFCIIVSLIAGWYISAKTVPIYIVSSRLIVKANEKASQSNTSLNQLAIGSDMLGSNKKLSNEIAILTSTPFIYTIIKRMNMNITYSVTDRFYEKSLYLESPFEVKLLEDTIKTYESYEIKIKNSTSFSLSLYTEQEYSTTTEYQFGDTVELGKNKFIVKLRDSSAQTHTDKLYHFNINSPEVLTSIYSSVLQVKQQSRDNSVLELSLYSDIPSRDVVFLNKFMEEYLKYGLEDKTVEASKTITFINEQLKSIGDSLQRVEKTLEKFKTKNNMSEQASPVENYYTQVFDLIATKNSILLTEKYYDYLEKYVQTNGEFTKDNIFLPSISIPNQNTVINGILTDLIDLQVEKNAYINNGASKNPALKSINARMEQFKAALLENLKNTRATSKISLKDVESRIKEMEQQIKAVPLIETELANIKRLFKINEEIFILLLRKKLEAEIARASASPDAKILEPATTSGVPIAPKRRNNFLIALLAGVGIPMLLVLLKEFLTSVIRSKADLERLSNIPIYGTVPHQKGKNPKPTAILKKPKSRLAESFRSVRTNLMFSVQATQKNATFLVTSSLSGEGKSFCSLSIALIYSSMQKRTLILLTDLRKPKFYLEDDNTFRQLKGLSNYLIGDASIDEIIFSNTETPYLDYIPPGALPPNPVELLMRPDMDKLMSELKQRYDFIIIDSAPLGLVNDPLTMTKYADGIVYIVKQGYTPFFHIRNLEEMFQEGKLKNIGLLLNNVKMNTEGYGYYGSYGYYGGYYEDETESWWQKINQKLWNRK